MILDHFYMFIVLLKIELLGLIQR